MRKIILSLLAVVIIAGLLAATGYTGYRFGYAQGAQVAQSTTNRDEIPQPRLRPFDEFGPRGLPGRDFRFDRNFHREFGMRRFPMMRFGFFSPLMFLGQIFLLVLIAGLVYWLFTRSGWQLTRTAQTTERPAPPVETEVTNRNNESQD